MDDASLITLLIAAASALLLALMVLGTQRLGRRLARQERALRALQDDFDALCAGTRGVGAHLDRLEQRLRRLCERQDQVELRDPAQRGYERAVRLIRNGADLAEVVSESGLLRTEVELLRSLHGAGEPPEQQRRAASR